MMNFSLYCAAFLAIGFIAGRVDAQTAAGQNRLLERAVSCELSDDEVGTLLDQLRRQDADFAVPTKSYALPTVDVYHLSAPVTALGYRSQDIAVAQGRIVMMLPNISEKTISQTLHLDEGDAFSPSSRDVRENVSLVAYHLTLFPGKSLLGCQYAIPQVNNWFREEYNELLNMARDK